MGPEEIRNFEFHATQIHTYRLCPRKFVFDATAKVEQRTDATDFGTLFHDRAEEYLHTRTVRFETPDDPVATLLSKGIHLLPKTRVNTEVGFHWRSPRGFLYAGRADWLTYSTLGDHKTTSDKKWAKDEETLRKDPQVLLYGMVFMRTHFHWTYFEKKTKAAWVVKWEMMPWELAGGFEALELEVASMAESLKKKPLQVIGNPEACEAYRGCPYLRQCFPSLKERLSGIPRSEAA